MGARWYNPANGSFGNKDTVTNKPVPDSASASPFGYAADNPLDRHRPHRALRPTRRRRQHQQGLAQAKVTRAAKARPPPPRKAATAHAAHLAHLAHLAVVAKAARWPPRSPRTAPGTTWRAHGTPACRPSTARPAAGDANGIPTPRARQPQARQAMGIVKDQYNAVQDAANKRDAAAAKQRLAAQQRPPAGRQPTRHGCRPAKPVPGAGSTYPAPAPPRSLPRTVPAAGRASSPDWAAAR